MEVNDNNLAALSNYLEQTLSPAPETRKEGISLFQDTSKQPIRTRYLGHVTGYQPIRDQYFQYLTTTTQGRIDGTASYFNTEARPWDGVGYAGIRSYPFSVSESNRYTSL